MKKLKDMELNGKPLTQEAALQIIRDYQQQRYSLSKAQAEWEVQKHRRTILKGFRYNLEDPDEYKLHAKMISEIGNTLMLREYSTFVIDEYNRDVLRFMTYYFNGCKLAEDVFPNEHYRLHKNLLLIGEPGTGKTMLMQIFSEYLRETRNDNYFVNISATQLMNYYKVHGHIDKYTYNECADEKASEGTPFNVCLNDLGLMTENQKSFGTMLSQVTDEFLFARYEIYQQTGKRYHITSNLAVKALKERFEQRLVDRFKSFNVIELHGGSRRK